MAITTNGGAGITADAVATLTNKTLTAPVISDATFTGAQAGLEIKFGNNIVLEGTTDNAFEMTLSGGDPTADRTVTLPDATGQVVLLDTTDTLTNKTLTSPTLTTPALGTPASGTLTNTTGLPLTTGVTGTLPVANGGTGITSLGTGVATLLGTPSSANLASAITDETGSGALVFGTSPVLTTPILKSPEERLTVSATAAATTVQYDVLTQGVLYYTSNASANWTLNVRGDSGTTLNDSLATNDSITIVFLVTQGSTAYYSNAFTIDGTSVTPKYITGTAFSAGNASSIDSYVYTIIKTGSATFTVLASQTKFA
jgi:hypothetical protein